MEITFTLNSAYTGATYVSGPYDISGTTCDNQTYWLVTGATKEQLTTGVTITTIYDNITGGTITSGGICEGTTQPWQTGIQCEGVGGQVQLDVYGKDLYMTPQNVSISYSVNSGTAQYLTVLDPIFNNCTLIGSITGLSLGDTVFITTDETYPLSGAGTSTCPNAVGGLTSYTHVVGASSGTDYVAIAIDSNNSL